MSFEQSLGDPRDTGSLRALPGSVAAGWPLGGSVSEKISFAVCLQPFMCASRTLPVMCAGRLPWPGFPFGSCSFGTLLAAVLGYVRNTGFGVRLLWVSPQAD